MPEPQGQYIIYLDKHEKGGVFLKIGVFTDSYKPYTSGVVTSITTFKQELIKMGHDIYIFAPSYPNYEEEEEKVYRFYSLPAPLIRIIL